MSLACPPGDFLPCEEENRLPRIPDDSRPEDAPHAGEAAVKLTLFVGNPSKATRSAIESLERLVREQPDQFSLAVIDVNEQPEQAEKHRILATPTLIRELPPPVRRLIGDLSRHREVRVALDLSAEIPPFLNEEKD